MCEHKDPIFFDLNMSESIVSALDQVKIQASKIQLAEKPAVDPTVIASLLLKSRAAQRDQFQRSGLKIDDMSWHILLDLFASAQAAKFVSVPDLATTHGLATSTMNRYVDYLVSVGMIDKNTDPGSDGRTGLRLTASGKALTSEALANIGDEFVNLG